MKLTKTKERQRAGNRES